VDISGPTESVAGEIDAACREIGFLSIVGHDVDGSVVAAAWGAAVSFFDLPLADKMQFAGGRYGYTPFAAEALGAAHGGAAPGDLKETFNLGPFHLGIGAVWPELPGFRDAWTAYYGAMDRLARRLLALFAVALGAEENALVGHFDRHTSALRALNYPAMDRPTAPGQIRAGAHSDYGSLTILLPGPGQGGLEVLTKEAEWLAVPLTEGSFVVNIGDLMERWTNDRWVSTSHRVVNPPEEVAGTERRQSIAFFQNPNADALIETLRSCLTEGEPRRYPPVRFGDWLDERVAAAHR
jgi:isopenicillin N synthase-like dioxygenase